MDIPVIAGLILAVVMTVIFHTAPPEMKRKWKAEEKRKMYNRFR